MSSFDLESDRLEILVKLLELGCATETLSMTQGIAKFGVDIELFLIALGTAIQGGRGMTLVFLRASECNRPCCQIR